MSQPVTISTAQVPSTYCPSGIQTDWPFLVSLLAAETNCSAYNFGPTVPGPDDQDKPWLRTDPTTGLVDRWYVFVGGDWVAKHPTAAGTIIMWEGAEGSIPTFDGGEAGIVTATTGPMWEKVSQMDGRFPMGPGTLPSGAIVAVTNTGGEERHELALTEIPNHDHALGGISVVIEKIGSGNIDLEFGGTDAKAQTALAEGGDPDDDDNTVPHNNLPPWYGVFFLRKTARSHYRYP